MRKKLLMLVPSILVVTILAGSQWGNPGEGGCTVTPGKAVIQPVIR